MHKAENVARYIINKSILKNDFIYCSRLQGLLVLSQYVHLHEYGKTLYSDAIVYKKLGPRVEGITNGYPAVITEPVKSYMEFEFHNDPKNPFDIDVIKVAFDEDMFSKEEKNTMNKIIEKYLNYSYHQLLEVNEEHYQLVKNMTRYVDIVREYKKDSQINPKWIKTI